jgi:hypothetical protein
LPFPFAVSPICHKQTFQIQCTAALGIDCDIDRDIKMCMLFADDPEHAGLREKLGVFYPLRAALRNR